MQVLFDTASGLLTVPHRACTSPACLEHRRYSPWESSTAVDVNNDGGAVQAGERLAHGKVNRSVVTLGFSQADLGSGDAKGVLIRDSVCLQSSSGHGHACAKLAVLAAIKLDDEPFRAMPHDGILGLALEGLATGALSSFYERLMDGSEQLLPHFGLTLGESDGEIVFGGHDYDRLATPLHWFPVSKPEEGFWQVKIYEVRVGDTVVDRCLGGCRGIVDTGSSSLGVQQEGMQRLLPSLQAAVMMEGGKCGGPDLQLDLGGFEIVLEAEDYTGTSCEPELGLLDLDKKEYNGVYALGTMALHRYYSAFDWAGARVGFAPLLEARRPSSATRMSRGSSTAVVV
mmetsp:Transcript_30566/g.82756  ORF Transcript_30566/g.82756 Transcript_30566/m.82756 type:complete len:342 (-) Transcript_30566:142-1167(-)